jgi:hypothetical protein
MRSLCVNFFAKVMIIVLSDEFWVVSFESLLATIRGWEKAVEKSAVFLTPVFSKNLTK